MQQSIHLAGIHPSAHVDQQQVRADNFTIAPSVEDYGIAKVNRNQSANDISTSTINKSILSDLYGSEVENLLWEIKSEESLLRSQEELRQISKQLLTTQENERQRIAADLHDGIGQSLSLIKLSLEFVIKQIKDGERQEALESLQQLSHKVKETMAELHRTTMDMRPSMLDDLGIIPTLSWFFREFESVWQGRKIEKEVSISEDDVPASLKTTIFRILQEATNNIVKHASADWIRVRLKKNGELLQLSIEDNGCGFDLDSVTVRCSSECCSFGCGFGLLTMKERARSSGGTLEMQSTPELGTRILISWRFIPDTADQNPTN